MVFRGCLENALYGIYQSRHPENCETWLLRHESREAYQKIRREFTIRKLLNFLKEVDDKIYQSANSLYERTIDYGAHPNERALTSNLRQTKGEGYIKFDLNYLTGNTPALHLCLRTNAQIGVCVLFIFRHVYRERYDILGISDMLEKLKKGL